MLGVPCRSRASASSGRARQCAQGLRACSGAAHVVRRWPTAMTSGDGKRLAELTRMFADELTGMDAYWRAANYLTVGQIYLLANPLLREPLRPEHIKPRLLGHWGTSPGLSLIYAHVNRLIRKHGVDALFLAGPGHGGPAVVANTYLEGTYSEIYPDISQDAARHGAPVPAVLDAGRHPQPCRAGHAGLDPRRRRARLRAVARVRRRVRSTRSARGRGGRRWRGRDRAARRRVEGHPLPERHARRRRAADPPPQRL